MEKISSIKNYPKQRIAVIELEYDARNAWAVVKDVQNMDLAACSIVFVTMKINFFELRLGKCFEVISHSSADKRHSFT